ncbi:MAG: tRNA 4-thiouridine(8) synthase ThiI [Oligoflexia bacterium]|nr:tRNA 4-thiouridine(8) synthase ThiI [Oligoflexia bacterium]
MNSDTTSQKTTPDTTPYREILLNIDELSLKGANQKFFLNKLLNHLRALLKLYHPYPISIVHDHLRYIIKSEQPFEKDTLAAMSRVPGLHSFSLVRSSLLELDALLSAVKEELAPLLNSLKDDGAVVTFKVETTRAYKGFAHGSYEVSSWLGHHLLQAFPSLKVDVHKPRLLIKVKILQRQIYFFTKTIKGVGGIPSGSSGDALTLLSGGFDSPVASYLMFKRGLNQSFAFFHAYPFVGDEVLDKVLSIVKKLSAYQLQTMLYIVPFGEIQRQIVKNARPAYRTIFFRRYMLELATMLATKIAASALITGDALGQVASQTLGNLALVNQCTNMPILRPLIGFSKPEILELAQDIGTYDISVIPQDDACSLLADKHPVTNPYHAYWQHFAKNIFLQGDLEIALKTTRCLRVDWMGKVAEWPNGADERN